MKKQIGCYRSSGNTRQAFFVMGAFLFCFGLLGCSAEIQKNSKVREVRKLLFRTQWEGYSDDSQAEIISDMEYSMEKIRPLIGANGISLVHDDSIRTSYTLVKGNVRKELEGITTDVDLWEACKKFYGISDKPSQ